MDPDWLSRAFDGYKPALVTRVGLIPLNSIFLRIVDASKVNQVATITNPHARVVRFVVAKLSLYHSHAAKQGVILASNLSLTDESGGAACQVAKIG